MAINSLKLKRYFFVLEKEDECYEREPSGHIKIEIRREKAKLTACVKNLESPEPYIHKLYLIKCGVHTDVACAGSIHTKDGTGILGTEIDTANVGNTGVPVDSFDTFVVIAENTDNSKNTFLCPLAAYKKGRTEWRSALKKYLQPEHFEESKQTEHKEEKSDKSSTQAVIGHEPQTVSSQSLSEIFDDCFTRCNPFNTTRRDYRWWKLYSPVQLNNILYQCNIKTALLFNPTVMRAHFKYGHLITGIYTDARRDCEYLVCGIPETSGENSKPFGEFCRWVQTEKTGPKPGTFGYWLVYMNINDGKLLNVN
jgi:hypothetical protein